MSRVAAVALASTLFASGCHHQQYPRDDGHDRGPADAGEADASSVIDPSGGEPRSDPGDADPVATSPRTDAAEEPDAGQVANAGDDPRDDERGTTTGAIGDPYLRDLIRDLLEAGGDYPAVLDSDGVPIACLRLAPDGTIVDTLLKQGSGNVELDELVERSLAALQKQRAADPIPVPDHLLRVTSTWICVRFAA